MKNVTRSVRFVLSMVLVMAMVLTSIGSLGTVAKAETGKAAVHAKLWCRPLM